jgi:hypothetical protein
MTFNTESANSRSHALRGNAYGKCKFSFPCFAWECIRKVQILVPTLCVGMHTEVEFSFPCFAWEVIWKAEILVPMLCVGMHTEIGE